MPQTSSTARLHRRNALIAAGLGLVAAAGSVGVATMPAWAGVPVHVQDQRVEPPPAEPPLLQPPLASP